MLNQPYSSPSICAVVVAFFPDSSFEDRLLRVLPQVRALLVIDNTPGGGCRQRLNSRLQQNPRLTVFENGDNFGIAAALNQGLNHARSLGLDWLLTLDQDTWPYPDMVETLLHTYTACGFMPAVVGSNYVDKQRDRLDVPSTGKHEWLERVTVITTGSLINTNLANAIGGFREDYFIDQVDHEFCLRMRAHQHRVVICRKPTMDHSVGTIGGAYVPILGTLPNHPPIRKYYIARNSIVTISRYWRQDPIWCLRRGIRLVLGLFLLITLEQQRYDKACAFFAGIMDGLNQRMGPYLGKTKQRSV